MGSHHQSELVARHAQGTDCCVWRHNATGWAKNLSALQVPHGAGRECGRGGDLPPPTIYPCSLSNSPRATPVPCPLPAPACSHCLVLLFLVYPLILPGIPTHCPSSLPPSGLISTCKTPLPTLPAECPCSVPTFLSLPALPAPACYPCGYLYSPCIIPLSPAYSPFPCLLSFHPPDLPAPGTFPVPAYPPPPGPVCSPCLSPVPCLLSLSVPMSMAATHAQCTGTLHVPCSLPALPVQCPCSLPEDKLGLTNSADTRGKGHTFSIWNRRRQLELLRAAWRVGQGPL